MNDSTKSKQQPFDTQSTGELSGSSTSNTTYPSPTAFAADKSTQTDEPFSLERKDSTISRTSTVYICQAVDKSPQAEGSEPTTNTSPDSEGPVSAGHSINDNEEKQNTDSKTLFEEDKGFSDRNKSTPENCRDGSDCGLSWFRRDRDDRCDLVKKRLDLIRPSPLISREDCWKLHSSSVSVKNCSVCRDPVDKVAFCTTCNEFVYIFPKS